MAGRLKCGAMACRPARSSISTNASKPFARLMESSFQGPVNIGSEEMVTINQMAEMIMKIAGKKLSIKHIPGPTGVRGRNSDNKLLRKELVWEPKQSLSEGLSKTYPWIYGQLQAASKESAKMTAGAR